VAEARDCAPVGGIVRPASAGLFLIAGGVSPLGTIHTCSPVFKSIAVSRL